MSDYFPNVVGFRIHDGSLNLYKLMSDGLVAELMEGTVVTANSTI
jgi:hypothetical protein